MAKGFNKVILMGNLTRDVEMRTTTGGQNVANFSLAVTRSWKGQDGQMQDQTSFINCVACQTLLFWIAIHDGDYQAAKDAEASVKRLYDKGQFANNNIRGNDAILTYDTVLYGISPEAKAKAGAS